jgi:hypothetical protein
MPAARSKSHSPAIGVGLLLLLFCLLLVSVFTYWRLALYFHVKKQLTSVRSAGLPTSGTELNDWLPQIPNAENGALPLTAAITNLHEFSELRIPKTPELTAPNRQELWTPEQRANAERYLATNRQTLAEIESVLNRYSKFQFPVDYSYGAGTLLSHLKYVKRTSQNLRYQTLLQSTSDDPAWTNSLLLQFKLADTLNSEPTVIGFLVRSAIINIAARSAEYALNHTTPDPASARALQAAFLRVTQTNTLPTALIGERALWIPYFRMSRTDFESFGTDEDADSGTPLPQTHKPSGKGFAPLMATGFFERDLDFFLDTMDKAISLSKLPPPASLELTNTFNVSDYARSHLYLFSGMFVPALSKVSVKAANAEAISKLAATAFSIESFRQKNNRVPKALDELVPEFIEAVPTDPFDGKPIRYRQTPRGFQLYSVDADGRDDHGAERPPRRKPNDPTTYDITFTVER